MANIKNFGLAGVGPDVQLGKGGVRVVANTTTETLEVRTPDGVSLAPIHAANAVQATELLTLGQYTVGYDSLSNSIANATIADGFELILGNATSHGDTAWSGGAVPLTDSTPVSKAVDDINTLLAKLVPTAPPNFPNGTNLVVSSSGSSPVLANGANNPASAAISAGTAVTRITTATVNASAPQNSGPGDSGTLNLFVNNSVVSTRTLTGSDVGTYSGGLQIVGQASYPASTPGFWKAINTAVNAASVSVGVNSMQMTDTAAGNTNVVFFVRDNLNTAPAVTNASIAQATATYAFSSSVPHYSVATMTVNGSISNLAGQTYFNGNPLSIAPTTASLFTTQNYSYVNTGITTPIAANTTSAVAITPVTLNVNGTNIHNSGQATLTGQNVTGTGGATASTIILVKNGTPGTRIDETSVTVSGLGSSPNNNNALRVGMATGDTPSDTTSAWVQTAALNTWDASVVAGLLKNDVTNYSTGYLPVGPNLSGQAAAQYVTFSFNRTALSQFKVNVTGTYAGLWIALPGVSDNAGTSPNALGGAWWNAFAAYNGAGVPGRTGDATAGCGSGTVTTGGTGAFQITFGTASSTSATGNTILVRFRLNTGQSISALSFTN